MRLTKNRIFQIQQSDCCISKTRFDLGKFIDGFGTVHTRGRRIAVYLHALDRFSFDFCTRARPIALRRSYPRSGLLAQNAVYRLMSRDMRGQHVDAGWFSVFAAACLREPIVTCTTILLIPFDFRTCHISRKRKLFSQTTSVESTMFCTYRRAKVSYITAQTKTITESHEPLPSLIRGGSGITRRFSRARMTSESAYATASSSIVPNFSSKSSGSFWGNRNHTTLNMSPLHISEKSLSFVTTMRSSARDMPASVVSSLDFSAVVKSIPRFVRNSTSSMRTFSSSRNRIGVDDDIVVSSQSARVLESGSYLLARKWSQESVLDILHAFTGRKHFHNLPYHDARALEGRFAVAYLRIGHDVFIDGDTLCHMCRSVAYVFVIEQIE